MSKLNYLNQANKNKAQNSSIGNLIKKVLPELITRNTKLCTRLKSKLKVCSFLNNVCVTSKEVNFEYDFFQK